jgi:hypothetical protein
MSQPIKYDLDDLDLDLDRLFDEHKEDKLAQEHEMLRVMLQDSCSIINRQRDENNLLRDENNLLHEKLSNLNKIVISLFNKIPIVAFRSYTVPDNFDYSVDDDHLSSLFEDSVDDDHLRSLFDDQDNEDSIS